MKKLIVFIFLIAAACSKGESSEPQTGEPEQGQDCQYPAQVLDLTNWKITLPQRTLKPVNPDEIKQPQLSTYKHDEYFFVNKRKDAVVFRAHTGGATTSGSNYPRSELREMVNNGKDPAAWSSDKGKHTLFIDQRVTHLPDVRKHIVLGQIHDAERYLIFFRLEDKRLLVSVNGGDRVTIDNNYQLGTRFNVKIEVSGNETRCYYNGELKYTWEDSRFSNAYFKAGAYVQSTCQGTKKVEGESCSAYGEVEIFDVWVKHE